MKQLFQFHGASAFADDTAKVQSSSLFLKGRAAEWWESEDKSGGIMDSWDQFVERLRHRYHPLRHADQARARIRSLKQTGSASAYADVFQSALAPIKDMAEADKIFNFIMGLSSREVANKVREGEPKTLHDAMDLAVRTEMLLLPSRNNRLPSNFGRSHAQSAASGSVPMDLNNIDDDPDANGTDTQSATPNANASALATLIKELNAVKLSLNALSQPKSAPRDHSNGAKKKSNHIPGLTAEEVRKLIQEGRCLKCKQLGHMKRDCPNFQ
jgi:hypothetical protein